MARELHILGTGGHARDVAEIAIACGYRPVFLARDREALEAWTGRDEIVLESAVADDDDAALAVGIGDNRTRARVVETFGLDRNYPALIHPHTSLMCGMREAIEEAPGTVVFPGVRIMGGCTIGRFATINLNATLSHDCAIGDFANLSPGMHAAGNVSIGKGAWIGMGVVVNQGTDATPRRIGDWATVGSGAVVLADIPAGETWAGVPARELGR